jgi:hypothetical protein
MKVFFWFCQILDRRPAKDGELGFANAIGAAADALLYAASEALAPAARGAMDHEGEEEAYGLRLCETMALLADHLTSLALHQQQAVMAAARALLHVSA